MDKININKKNVCCRALGPCHYWYEFTGLDWMVPVKYSNTESTSKLTHWLTRPSNYKRISQETSIQWVLDS